LKEACNAISIIVTSLCQGYPRRASVKKEPAMVKMLEAIVEDSERSKSLLDLKLSTVCLLGFSGFFRADEVLNL